MKPQSLRSFELSCANSRYKTSLMSMNANYPTKINNVITKMTESSQNALRSMTSRMEIELPPGADFGVEASGKQGSASKQKKGLESDADRVKRSNREAARLVAEMFSVLSTETVTLFPSENEANEARIKWGSTFKGEVFSIDSPAGGMKGSNLYSKRLSKQEQEQALLGTDGMYIPEGTEIIIIAGPRVKDIKKLKKIHEKLGDDTLIVLINARASLGAVSSDSDNGWVNSAFTSVFHYAPPIIDNGSDKRELLLYHEFNSKWYLAEKELKDGILGSGIQLPSLTGNSGFKTVWEGENKPIQSEILELLKLQI